MDNPQQQKPEVVYTLRAPRMLGGKNRVGEECVVINRTDHYAHIRFADGHEAMVSKYIIRQKKKREDGNGSNI